MLTKTMGMFPPVNMCYLAQAYIVSLKPAVSNVQTKRGLTTLKYLDASPKKMENRKIKQQIPSVTAG